MIRLRETGSQMRGKRWRIHLLVLLAYTLLALVLTWPVVTHFGSHVPGNGADDPPLTWNLWWVQYALLDLGTNPFDGNYLFYPLGINLAFYTLTALNGLLSIPLQAVVGLIPASNLLLLSSFVLSGYGAFLLAIYLLRHTEDARSRRQETGRTTDADGRGTGDKERDADRAPQAASIALDGFQVAAFVAGSLYAYASSKLAYAALGQWNIASSQWIPFCVLYLLKMAEDPWQWRYPFFAALFLLCQAYAELTYASFLLLFTLLWAIWQFLASLRLPRPQGLRQARRLVINLALVGALFVIGLSPILAMMVPDLRVEGDIFVEGGGFADVFSADLLGFLVPTMYHPLLGFLVELFRFDYSVGQHIYVGYAVLVLATLGAIYGWRRSMPPPSRPPSGVRIHPLRFWVLSTSVFWLLTLGPSLRINGHDTGLPLPFALVAQLPFFKGNRYPSRYSVMLDLSLAMLVAFGLAALHQAHKRPSRDPQRSATLRLVALLLVILLLFEHLSIPLPLSDMRVPSIYQAIADEIRGDAALLDLPVAWRNGFRVTGTQDPIIMFEQYYQTVHGKRILAGNTSRNPPLKFQYFTEAPVLNTLVALETGHAVDPAVVEHDRVLAPEVLRFFNIHTLVVHLAQAGPDMVPYIEATMPVARFYADQDIVAYQVDLPPWPEAWTVEPGDDLGGLSYAEGWGIPTPGLIWAQRRAVRLLVPLNGMDQRMTFRAYSPLEGQQLQLEVNDQTVQSITMAPGWMDYEIPLPAAAVQPGLNEIWLRFEKLVPAGEIHLSARAIGETGVESPVNLVVQSAGQEVGNFGRIYVNGQDVSPNGRGYNVVVMHPQTGEVERTAVFDTHLDEGASQALAAFLAKVPPGHIVAVAAADEASRLLGEEAVEALHNLGASGDLRGKFRWGEAIIGVQGAPPGTALEAMDWMRPVAVVAGEAATESHLAAAFSTLTFRAIEGQ